MTEPGQNTGYQPLDLGRVVVRGRVETANGSKYLQQLCKHWHHKFPVTFSKDRGEIRSGSDVVTLEATADGLCATLETGNREAAERLKEVVVRHLNRFAFREAPLAFEWVDVSPLADERRQPASVRHEV